MKLSRIQNVDYIDNLLHVIAPSCIFVQTNISQEKRIRTLALFEVILRNLSLVRNGPETLKSSYRLFRDQIPLLRILAKYEEIPMLPKNISRESINFPPNLKYGPIKLALFSAVMHCLKGKTMIEALELSIDKEFPIVLRSAFLGKFGRWLESLNPSNDRT